MRLSRDKWQEAFVGIPQMWLHIHGDLLTGLLSCFIPYKQAWVTGLNGEFLKQMWIRTISIAQPKAKNSSSVQPMSPSGPQNRSSLTGALGEKSPSLQHKCCPTRNNGFHMEFPGHGLFHVKHNGMKSGSSGSCVTVDLVFLWPRLTYSWLFKENQVQSL